MPIQTATTSQTKKTETETSGYTLLHWINGEAVASQSGKTFKNLNPATGELLCQVASGDSADIDTAVKAAQTAFESGPWPQMSLKERCQILKTIGDLILENRETLARAETLDTGKPITESMTGDIPRAAENFHFFADYAPALSEEFFTNGPDEHHLALREPLGVVGLITPWNLPLYLATWKIAPCLAMGNTCVLKPAEWTPTTAFLLAKITQQAGLPPGVLNVVQGFGPNSAGEALTRHPDVKAISFTGEGSTGKAIMAAASDTLKKISLELGGKGATILFADANLEEAIPTAIRAAYRNQGQICLAGSRLLVQEKIFNKVIKKLVKEVKAIRVGDPLDPNTQMGSLVHKNHAEKVMAYMTLAEEEGRLLTGGQRPTKLPFHLVDGCFLTPAVVVEVAHTARVCQEEIFGPLLPVVPFQTEADAIDMANSTPYGLSASVWSQDVDRCHRVARSIRSGLVWVNCWFKRDLRTPFGGMKASGVGREGGRDSLAFFSEAKTVTYQYR